MLSFKALYTYCLDLHVNIKNNILKEKTSAIQKQAKEKSTKNTSAS
jgi:hypothetical protein